MPAALTCPGCQRPLRLPEATLGRTVRCPLCWEEFLAEREQANIVADRADPPPSDERGADEAASLVLPAASSSDALPVLPMLPDEDARPIVPPGPTRAKPLRFPAFLSRDPERLLKGLWEGELTEDGLRLTRSRNPEVWVPVGRGAAQYLGGNRLTVRVRGRSVALTIVSNGADLVRLARDVAAFLNNERGPLEADSYRVRRLIYAASLAPLAAPGLALALHVHTRTGWGLFGWAVLGVGAALLALSLLRRGSWSVRQRLIASAVPALFAVGVVGIAYAAGGATPPPIEPSQWRTETITLKDGTAPFSVRMPGKPQSAVEFYGWWGDLSVVDLPKNHVAFAAGALEVKGAGPGFDDASVFNDKRAAFQRLVPHATLLSDSPVNQGQRRGREFVFEIDGPRFRGVLVVRLFLVGRSRLHFLAAAGTHLQRSNPETLQFLDSYLPAMPDPPRKLVPVGPSLSPNDLPGGAPVLYWSFELGEPDHGFYQGAAKAVPGGVRGRALKLPGVFNSYFDLDKRDPKLNFDRAAPFTFVGWLRTTNENATVLSLRDSDNVDPRIDLSVRSGRLRLYLHDSDGGAGPAVPFGDVRVDNDAWHHFAFGRDAAGRVRLYVDGKLDAESGGGNAGGAITTNRRTFGRLAHAHLGENMVNASAMFEGWLDDIALFDRVLSDDEIQRLARLP